MKGWRSGLETCGYLHHAYASTVTLLFIALGLSEIIVHTDYVAHPL